MGFAKPIEQIFIKLSRYIYVSKRYYTRRNNMEYFFKKQSRKTKERIRDMENSTWNNYKLSCDDDNSIPGIKSEGVLHGWKF